MASIPLRPVSQQRFALRKLVWVGPLTIVVAALVNVVIRSVAVAFFGVPAGFTDLQAPVVIGSTVVYLLLAILACFCGILGQLARVLLGAPKVARVSDARPLDGMPAMGLMLSVLMVFSVWLPAPLSRVMHEAAAIIRGTP